MKKFKYISLILCFALLTACGGGGGGSSDSSSTSPDGTVSVITDSGDSFNLVLSDESGNALENMDVEITEKDGIATIVISDPNKVYSSTILIGTADELAEEFAGTSRAARRINLTLNEHNSNSIGFMRDAENVGYLYMSDNIKKELWHESGVYTITELVNYLKEIYAESAFEGYSFLQFTGEVSDSTASTIMYKSILQADAGQGMYYSLNSRIAYLYGDEVANDISRFYVDCYYPEGTVSYDSICEITNLSDVVESDIFIGGIAYPSVTAGSEYVFYPAAYDSEDDDLTFSIENKPSWASFDESTGALTGTPTVYDAGTYARIIISVTDGENTVYLEPFSITVYDYNSPPVIGGTPYESVTGDSDYSFYPYAYDADGGELTFSIENMPSWASFNPSTGALTGTPTELDAGLYANIIISVTDGEDSASLEPFAVTVYEYNSPPVIGGTPQTNVTGSNGYFFYPYAYDADGDQLTFSIENKPSWASFNPSTGALTGSPVEDDADVYSSIMISVSDGQDTTSMDTFEITVNTYNSAPVLLGTPKTTVTADNEYEFIPAAYDADGDALTFSITGKPSWASFNTATGVLTGTPTEADAGEYTDIGITVSDGEEADSIGFFSITVSEYNSAPVIMGKPITAFTANNAYNFYPSVYDADGDALTYSITNKPSWASFNTSTGALTGKPGRSKAGTYSDVTISVSDGQETSTLSAFDIEVNSYNTAPYIGGAKTLTASIDNFFRIVPGVYDADGDSITLTCPTKPGWATFESSTGKLYGTPTAAGDYSAKIVAKDTYGATSSYSFTIAVTSRLMWQDDPNNDASDDFHEYGFYNAEDVINKCANLVVNGYDDWRLPTVDELMTLVDTSKDSKPYIVDGFKYVASSCYRTSTLTYNAVGHYGVCFNLGDRRGLYDDDYWQYRCVRDY